MCFHCFIRFYMLHVSYGFIFSQVTHDLSRAKVSVLSYSFSILSCFQHSNSHTRTLNVLMRVGLHRVMMQTHVTNISIIHCLVDPAEHSESIVNLLAFRRTLVIRFSDFFSLLDVVGFVLTSILVLQKLHSLTVILSLSSFYCRYFIYAI